MGARMSLPVSPVPLWRRVPADPATHFTAEEVARSKRYTRPIKRARRLIAPFSWGMVLAWIGFEVGPWIAERVGGPWPVQLVVVFVSFIAALVAVHAPVTLWRKLVHDKRWGFSTTNPQQIAIDTLKAGILAAVIGGALLIPIWALIRSTTLWWVFGAGVIALFQLVMRFLGPTLLRVFNKLEPLPDGSLKDRLAAIATSIDAPVSDYLVMDASKRTSKDNAAFTGVGKTKQVILFDNILQMPEEQVAIVVAHELGHWRRARPIRDTFIGVATLPAMLGVAAAILGIDAVRRFGGVSSLGEPGALPLFITALLAIGEATGFASAWWSRVQERQADLDALDLTRDPQAYAGTWKSMRERNLPDLDPSLLDRLKASHPPIAERLEFGRIWARARAADAAGTPAP